VALPLRSLTDCERWRNETGWHSSDSTKLLRILRLHQKIEHHRYIFMYQRFIQILAIALIALSLIGPVSVAHASGSPRGDTPVMADHHVGEVVDRLGCLDTVSVHTSGPGDEGHAGGSMCCTFICGAAEFSSIGLDTTGFRTMSVIRQIVLQDLHASSLSGSPLRRPPKA
jgi:hypothetical protein